jgi:protein O-GlcNAc transferase
MKKRKKKKILHGKKRGKKSFVSSNKMQSSTNILLQKAIQYHQSGYIEEAEKIYKKILKLSPNHPVCFNCMGIIAWDSGRTGEAVEWFNKAIQNDPTNPRYHSNLGNALKDQGRLAESISSSQRALELNPNLAEAYNNLGIALGLMGKLEEAKASLERAFVLKPDYADAYYNLGLVVELSDRPDDSISCYQKSLQLDSNNPKALVSLVFRLRQIFAWEDIKILTAQIDRFTQKAINNGTKIHEPPIQNILRCTDLSRNFAIAHSVSADIAKSMSNSIEPFSFDGRESEKKRITIGYLSNDFRNHPVAHLMSGLFGLHNRDGFEIFCYSYGPTDESYYRQRISQDCDKFVDLKNVDFIESAKQIYSDQVDILVDLTGHTRGNRLEICALKPAPVQVSYLGFPGTTGADFIDYIITDKIVTPEDHACYYSEQFVYLPHCYLVNDNTQAIAKKDWEKRDFDLPENGIVFCSFNQAHKIEPIMFDVWMRILQQVPESVLWLKGASKRAKTNLIKEAESRGVKAGQLVFAKRMPTKEEHLTRLAFADLALDTRIYNGHVTTSDALWAGVPVIALKGDHFASRVSASILTAISLPELITRTPEEYEALAVGLGSNPSDLKAIRKKLARNRQTEPLFDTPRFVRNLEGAYKEMWSIFLAGERPRQLEVVES